MMVSSFELIGAEKNLYYRLFQATDASYNDGFLLNPAMNPSAAMSETGSSSKGKMLVASSDRKTSVENSSNNQSMESKVENTIVAGSFIFNAGAGLSLVVNGEYSSSAVDSNRLDSNNIQEEALKDLTVDGRVSIVLTEQFALGVTLKSQRIDYDIKGNITADEDEITSYSGTIIGPGYGVKGTVPLGSVVKQVDYSLVFIEPLKGKTQVNGEQFVMLEPSVLEFGASFLVDKFLAGFAYRTWEYSLDDRYFGTIFPNENASDVNLFGLDPQRTSIFPLRNVQLGVDYQIQSKATLRLSYSFEKAEVNFSPDNNPPGVTEEPEAISYNSMTFGGSYTHRGLDVNGVVRFSNKNSRLEQNTDITISSSEMQLILSVAAGI
jgi:hypothetical protein